MYLIAGIVAPVKVAKEGKSGYFWGADMQIKSIYSVV
jgi:hypothetical protein